MKPSEIGSRSSFPWWQVNKSPIDPIKLENIRDAVETGLLAVAPDVYFFSGFAVATTGFDATIEQATATFGNVEKAQLVSPPMNWPVFGFEEYFVQATGEFAASRIWNEFRKINRRIVLFAERPDEATYWEKVSSLAQEAGPSPTLVVSHEDGQTMRDALRSARFVNSSVKVERRSHASSGGSYIATINGIDVFHAQFKARDGWLFFPLAL